MLDSSESGTLSDRELLRDVLEWDIDSWKRALRIWSQWGGELKAKRVLEIGGCNGGLSLWFALRGARVVCSDLNEPRDDSKRMHERYGVSERVSYASVDATAIPYLTGEFDVVCFKSVLGGIGAGGHIERQEQAIAEIYRVLRPGGKLLFAENLTGSPLHRFARHHFVEWGRRWKYLTREEVAKLLRSFSCVQMVSYGCLSAFGRSEWQRTALHWADVIVQPMLPRSWRYTCIACATK
jgi:ubiquinone/menaquinone biosynthesis C-methylase UbiE